MDMKLPVAAGESLFQPLNVPCVGIKELMLVELSRSLVLNEPCARVCGFEPALHGANRTR